jgi:hypothetical protein
MANPVGYVAYIDEAGDDGLNRSLKPDDPRGASEWMVMSAVVVRAENDHLVLPWLREIIRNLNQHQLAHLHFRNLREDKKSIVCRDLAKLPIRCFIVMSHKKNMQNYKNLSAERAKLNRTAWFFCWLSRLLLERITTYCDHRSRRNPQAPKALRVEFSDRGGVNIEDIRSYYRYLSAQSQRGMLYHDFLDLAWSVVDVDQMLIFPNRMRAGLQLADVVSSAFHQAVERTPAGLVRPEPAKLLLPRVCPKPMSEGRRFGYGLKIMPTWIPSRLPADQREIIDFYTQH